MNSSRTANGDYACRGLQQTCEQSANSTRFVNRRRFRTAKNTQRDGLVRIEMRHLAPSERWSAFLNEMRDAFLEIL